MHFAPASLVDYAAMYPAAGNRMWKVARVQILAGPAWTLWADGTRQAICGLYPLRAGVLEAWLMLAEAEKPKAPALRFLLNSAAAVCPESAIICRVSDGNRAGQRLAALAGFEPTGDMLGATDRRTWLRPAFFSAP